MAAKAAIILQEGHEEEAGLHTAMALARSPIPSFSYTEVCSCF